MSQNLVKQGAKTWKAWQSLTLEQDNIHDTVTIALVGKYTNHPDAYHSVVKALEHSSMACSRKLVLRLVSSEALEPGTESKSPTDYHHAWHTVHSADGVIVPGGFGERGIAGMLAAIRSCRENGKPYLGICLGMQLAVIEYARNVCGIKGANTVECEEHTKDPIIIHMPEVEQEKKGATMRLGLRPTLFQKGSEFSKLRKLYERRLKHKAGASSKDIPVASDKGSATKSTANGPAVEIPYSTEPPVIINERHRHRYEVNPSYVDKLAAAGLNFIGKDEKGERMEILELKDHKWFVGVQYHPEYLSRVLHPSEPYLGK